MSFVTLPNKFVSQTNQYKPLFIPDISIANVHCDAYTNSDC